MDDEQIRITFAPGEVGVRYFPATPEQGISDELAAAELALHALARHAAALRSGMKMRVPDALTAVISANTWEQLR